MYTSVDFRIALTDVDYRTIKTTDDKVDYIGKHGTLASATYARGRQVVIE
jgi:hypothetical protein